VSQPTLRKDLTVLEQQGLLKRTHGGALSIRAPGGAKGKQRLWCERD